MREAGFVTAEDGLDLFSSQQQNVVVLPLLAGYRYTLDRSGTGFYLEPNAGYSYGGTDIPIEDQNRNYADQKVSGVAAGARSRYPFEPAGRIQCNLGLRYEHIFGPVAQNCIHSESHMPSRSAEGNSIFIFL